MSASSCSPTRRLALRDVRTLQQVRQQDSIDEDTRPLRLKRTHMPLSCARSCRCPGVRRAVTPLGGSCAFGLVEQVVHFKCRMSADMRHAPQVTACIGDPVLALRDLGYAESGIDHFR